MLANSRQWAGYGLLVSSVIFSQANAFVISATNSSSASTTSTKGPPLMTTAPGIADPFEVNTCSYYNATDGHGHTLWDDPWCSIYVGTVDLVFWPTTGNHSYPSTYRDSIADYTFTSPSVYMIVNTMYGWNPCGPLGPSASRQIFSFDLTEVSTLVPYTDEVASTRRATRQLHLSDLDTHCSRSFNRSELATQTRPIKDDDTRCNPFLAVPRAFKAIGYPYWLHCGIKNHKFGVFDPPYAIPALDELVPAHTTSADKPDTDKPTAVPSATAKPPPGAGSLETSIASQHKTDPAPGGSNGGKPTAHPGKPQPTAASTANAARPSNHQADGGDAAIPVVPEVSDGLGASKPTLGDPDNAKPTPVSPVNTKAGDSPGHNNAEAGNGSGASQATQVNSNNAKPTHVNPIHVDPANTKAIDGPGDNNAGVGNSLSIPQATQGNPNKSNPTHSDPVNTKAIDSPGDNKAEAGDNLSPSGVAPGHSNNAVSTPSGASAAGTVNGSGDDNAHADNSPAVSQVSGDSSHDTEPTKDGPANNKAVNGQGHSNGFDQEDGEQDIVNHHGNPEAVPITAGHAGHSGHGDTRQSAVDASNTKGPAIIPGMESDPTTIFHGVVSTVTNQVASLGTAGLEVVNMDTGETSTYAVPAAGAPQSDGALIPASVVVYNGHTIKQGGPAVTVTNAVVRTLFPASPTENRKSSVNTASLDGSSSTVSAVGNSPASKVTHGTYGIVLAMLAYGWVYL